MVCGVFQHYNIDYEEKNSFVMKITSLHLLIALVATYDLEIHQMHVKTAFLNGILTKEIYMIDHLDMQNPTKNTKCVTFCRPLMGSNKFLANGMKDSPHIFPKLDLLKVRLIKMFTSSMTTNFLFSLGFMWMTLFQYPIILIFSKLLKLNFHKLLR